MSEIQAEEGLSAIWIQLQCLNAMHYSADKADRHSSVEGDDATNKTLESNNRYLSFVSEYPLHNTRYNHFPHVQLIWMDEKTGKERD